MRAADLRVHVGLHKQSQDCEESPATHVIYIAKVSKDQSLWFYVMFGGCSDFCSYGILWVQ
eukprot:187552-Amphidinium_carterae.1